MHFTLATLAALAGLSPLVSAHMEMKQPYALRSKFNPANQASQDIDYSMTSPLLADGSNYPCKGYQNVRPIETVATYSAGSTYQLELAGSATHNGGSCQLSLSYDNGKTFRVFKSMIGGCPLTSSYDFTIPDFAPNGTALFAWSWQNHSGNREFYMNCAEVAIVSSAPSAAKLRRHRTQKARRDTFTSFDQLPGIWQANMPKQNDCTTTEGEDPVYPHPGPQVEYGSGLSASSPPTPGTCDSVSPPGPTYKDLTTDASGSESGNGASSPVSGASSNAASTPSATPALSSFVAKAISTPASSSPATSTPAASPSSVAAAIPSSVAASSAEAPASSTATPSATSAMAPPRVPATAAPVPTAAAGSGDDVVAKASCTTDGSFGCMRGGQGFAVCDHSAWTDMGSVAAGTTCIGVAGSAVLVADMAAVSAVGAGRKL